MTDNVKNKVVTCVFLVFLYGIFFINIFKEPTLESKSERRKLATFPSIISEDNTLNEKFMTEFATYATDQFVARDSFRAIKASFLYNVLNQKDNNDIYIADGHASKYIETMKESEVIDTAKRFNRLYNQYLKKMNVYYSIIPDKNYFLAEKNGYPHMDYQKFENIFVENMNNKMKYIDIMNVLNVNDYYTTDIHWKQEKLQGVSQLLLQKMNSNKNITFEKMQEKEMYPFYGTYYGQSALPLEAETLKYITNNTLEKVTVKILNEEALKESKIEWTNANLYDIAAFSKMDPYDIYLSGPKALIKLENPNAKSQKELIVFRDSFGSSIAPWFVEEYSKITLVDLRYIASPLLKSLVEFKDGQDVLFLYSTEVLNNGSILKIM